MEQTLCEKLISSAINTGSCDDIIYGGYEQIGYIFNKKDISAFTRSGNLISAITMKQGKKGYHIYQPSKQPFSGSNVTLNEGTSKNKFDKNASFVVLNDGAKVCENIIDPIANGEFVVITEQKFTNSTNDNKFEVIGIEMGARATAVDKDRYSEDTDGGWAVTLTETAAPSAGVFFLTTDIEASRTALEALVA